MGVYWDNGKENGNYYLGFRVYSPPYVDGIWVYIGIMEKKMETTIWGLGFIVPLT